MGGSPGGAGAQSDWEGVAETKPQGLTTAPIFLFPWAAWGMDVEEGGWVEDVFNFGYHFSIQLLISNTFNINLLCWASFAEECDSWVVFLSLPQPHLTSSVYFLVGWLVALVFIYLFVCLFSRWGCWQMGTHSVFFPFPSEKGEWKNIMVVSQLSVVLKRTLSY